MKPTHDYNSLIDPNKHDPICEVVKATAAHERLSNLSRRAGHTAESRQGVVHFTRGACPLGLHPQQ